MFKVRLLRLLLKVFYLFPVNSKKVFFSSFEGKRITCNPKYIFEYLKDHNYDLRYIWELNNKKGKDYAKHNSMKYIYHILTSKYVISNNSISPVLPIRRKKQIVVNTWHGSGAYKKVGKYVDESINGTSNERQKLINKQTTYLLSGCKKWSEIISDSLDCPIEKFLATGQARNTIFFKDNDISSLKEKYGFKKDDKICLYAPTFRGNTGEGKSETYNDIDVSRVIDSLKERFGGNWVFATRCHYHDKSRFLKGSIDLSSADDMQELLLISDVLISDYSSSIWDYSFTYKPCFLYCYDLNSYKSERDFYVPIEEWGFPIANDFNMLLQEIKDFDASAFKKKMIKHQSDLGSYEGIDAARKAVEIIFGKNERRANE